MNVYHDPQALMMSKDPPGVVNRLLLLIEEEELKEGTIINVEVSLIPSDGTPRILMSSAAGKELPFYIVGGRDSAQSWGQRVIVALTPLLGEQPTGQVTAMVWLDSKKSNIQKRIQGRMGATGLAGAGTGLPGVTVSFDWAMNYAREQCRILWAEIQALRVNIQDLVKANTDMASRGIGVAEAVPAATASAVALVQQANGGWIGQLAQGAASVMLGMSGGGGASAPALLPGAGPGGPARVLYQLRDRPPGTGVPGDQAAMPTAPTAELVYRALEEVGEEMATDAVAMWMRGHGAAALARLKSDRELQAALGLPPAAVAFLR